MPEDLRRDHPRSARILAVDLQALEVSTNGGTGWFPVLLAMDRRSVAAAYARCQGQPKPECSPAERAVTLCRAVAGKSESQNGEQRKRDTCHLTDGTIPRTDCYRDEHGQRQQE